MKRRLFSLDISIKAILLAGGLLGLFACSEALQENTDANAEIDPVISLNGIWLFEQDGSIMADPQTSGLVVREGKLISISDGSALPEQRRRLHFIDPESGIVEQKAGPMSMSSRVRRSCFAQYLSDEPDFEALVVDPNDPSVFIIVTEDATRTGALSPRCQERFSNTGSTAYPTLLVRVLLSDGKLTMTHVRPIQYPLDYAVGDFPNDGIESLAFDKSGNLYLGLEKDNAGQPRIFSVKISEAFWQESDFAAVHDPELLLPIFESGNHPINGMDYLNVGEQHPGLLIAAARNDNQLWVIDLAKVEATRKIDLRFLAPTLTGEIQECESFEVMDNSSLEGVAIAGDTIWLINDPWKQNYLKNVQCPSNQARYSAMAPLLFSLPIQREWLAPYIQ